MAKKKIVQKKTNDSVKKQQGSANAFSMEKKKKDIKNGKPNSEMEIEKPNQQKFHGTQFSDKIFRTDYMKKFIEKGSTDYHGKCEYCNREILIDNLYDHIKSGKHRIMTKAQEIQDLDALITEINKYGALRKSKKAMKEEKNSFVEDDNQNYLEFLSYAISERLSFSQISKIGLFLKDMMKRNKLKFLIDQTFNEEEISLIARECFQKPLLEDIYKNLKTKPFSLIIDNSTVCAENFCVLQTRYCEKINFETVITHKLIKIHKLQNKSDAETMHNIIKEELLFDEEISKNLVGIVHDNASSLTGKYHGLVKKMQKEKPELFSLKDPCHCINLILKNSLGELPENLIKFVLKIHQHFKSPQRKALLSMIQKENNKRQLGLKPYIKTRWLSLGNSLNRIIEIWDSLQLYMIANIKKKNTQEDLNDIERIEVNEEEYQDSINDIDNPEDRCGMRIEIDDNEDEHDKIKAFNYEYFLNLLSDKSFHTQILFLTFITNKLNEYNVKFQSQSLEPCKVKALIQECYNLMLSFMIPSDKLDFNVDKFIKINWVNPKSQKQWFYNCNDFVKHLSEELEPELFKDLKLMNIKDQKIFYNISCAFIAKILKLIPHYFTFKKDILDLTSFLELKTTYADLKNRMIQFGKHFKILDDKNMAQFSNQIIKLQSNPNLQEYKAIAANNTLKLWDMIGEDGIELITKVVQTAQALPTTSASIEQAFSILKLFKTDKRNQLCDDSLEALMLINEEFRFNGSINITDQMKKTWLKLKMI